MGCSWLLGGRFGPGDRGTVSGYVPRYGPLGASGRCWWGAHAPSAGSGRFLWSDQVGFVDTAVDSADAVGQLSRRQQASGLDHLALAMQPLRLNRIEPRTLAGQEAHKQPDAVTGLLGLPV